MLLLAAASMDQKILRDADRQLPLFWRHSAESKIAARLRKLGRPGRGRQIKSFGGEADGILVRRRRQNVVGKMESMAGADGPGPRKAKNRFPWIIRSSRGHQAGSVPGNFGV